MKKRCALVLPYFGKFNNYFQLFLDSCIINTEFDFLIFTDSEEKYKIPSNVRFIKFTLQELKVLASKKIGMEVKIDTPYKLCDYKPAYGLIFEDYLNAYEYWGHCDCDLLFGDLNKLLLPVLDLGYDKIFAAGHLTLYKNDLVVNQMFKTCIPGKYTYKDVFLNSQIFVFDEDFQKTNSEKNINIQEIFLQDSKFSVFSKDLSLNISGLVPRFCRASYSLEKRTFIREQYTPRRYYWCNGRVITCSWDKETKRIVSNEYIYIHLQMRKMKVKILDNQNNCVEILPDRFISANKLPNNKHDMRLHTIRWDYGVGFSRIIDRINRKVIKRRI